MSFAAAIAEPSVPAAAPPLLTVRDLHVSYGPIRALQGVTIVVPAGQIVTLIGCNGAGKSTLLRAISRLVPAQGMMVLNRSNGAVDMSRLRPHQVVRLGVMHCPEGRGVFAQMTVAENLQLGAYLREPGPELAGDMDRVFALFPRLAERRKQLAGTLSGGEQQMLAIARALLGRPTLLMLDEPSLGLAPQLVQQIFTTIREINRQGTTLLLVEQNAHMALAVAHHAYVLETGRVTLSGPASELAKSDAVRKAYLGED